MNLFFFYQKKVSMNLKTIPFNININITFKFSFHEYIFQENTARHILKLKKYKIQFLIFISPNDFLKTYYKNVTEWTLIFQVLLI